MMELNKKMEPATPTNILMNESLLVCLLKILLLKHGVRKYFRLTGHKLKCDGKALSSRAVLIDLSCDHGSMLCSTGLQSFWRLKFAF